MCESEVFARDGRGNAQRNTCLHPVSRSSIKLGLILLRQECIRQLSVSQRLSRISFRGDHSRVVISALKWRIKCCKISAPRFSHASNLRYRLCHWAIHQQIPLVPLKELLSGPISARICALTVKHFVPAPPTAFWTRTRRLLR